MADDTIAEKPSPSAASSGSGASPDLLHDALYPSDSYTSDGRYWADLTGKERSTWLNAENNKEARRELGVIGAMFKRDPLSPFSAYYNNFFLNGMGLFVEGYTLFSIGNLTPLFSNVWPTCWKTFKVCNETLVDSVTYLEIVGIIIGQVLVGVEGDWVGRKFGLVQDAAVMLVGVIGLTAIWAPTLQGWVAGYVIFLWLYGVGVGGEYPMTSTRAIENVAPGPAGIREDRLHRGRRVVLAFIGQGLGTLFNQVLLMILLVIFHGKTTPPYTEKVAQLTYRVSFGVIAVLHTWLLYHRVYHIKDADKAVRLAKAKLNTSGYSAATLNLVFGHYWHRLVAVSGAPHPGGVAMNADTPLIGSKQSAGAWFANDFFFYGNKIFAGTFINVIHPGASLFVTWEFNLVNIAVSLCGYYLSAILVDHKRFGRKRIQQMGFFFDFVLFLFGAIFFAKLTSTKSPKSYIKVFQFMYYMSSFFNQFGPNCTTFLVAGEIYPTSVRATAHGFSAAVGKLGALAPTILSDLRLSKQTKFWVVPWFGMMGALLTFFFLPDSTGLDLREQERYWRCVQAGHPEEYHGIAIHRQHLSWYEIHVLKRDRYYDPALDKEARIDELRVLYESSLIAKEDLTGGHDDAAHLFITPEVATYFGSEDISPRVMNQTKKEKKLHEEAPDVRGRSALEDTMGKY